MENRKVILVIMDGWGHGQIESADAIKAANTPFVDSLYAKYPNAELVTHGEAVGLPGDQMGNSEVGHMNLGAGRVVYQELLRINNAVKDKSLVDNKTLKTAFAKAKNERKTLHFVGLVSEGGVHSSQRHLEAMCDMAKGAGLSDVKIHAFTDGRDCDPKSGLKFMENLENHLEGSVGEIATMVGRYYGMDRDKRWDRVKKAYDMLVNGEGATSTSIIDSIRKSYIDGITDEFIEPVVKVDENGKPVGSIKAGDVVVCFNFRTDRCREITQVLTQEDMHEFNMHKLDLHYVTMTEYDAAFKGVEVIFRKDNLSNTLGEVVSKAGKKQLRIAETEKYPHVSFFYSGGREANFEGESRIMINSPKVATYDLQPEMSAFEIRDAIVSEIENEELDFVCLNFANTDMVGHTGVWSAAMKAAETVDTCVKDLTEAALAHGYTIFLTADHGNSDFLVNADGSPNTAHSKNLVPWFLIGEDVPAIKSGKLGDVAPTILKLMGLEIPSEMTGDILV